MLRGDIIALDGVAIYNVVNELKTEILGGRVDKIYQPENDEIILQVRCFGKSKKILLTANASNPRINFSSINKDNPITAPLFCMVLRKHLVNGKILDISQPNFDRIVNITIESINELGDYSKKYLIIEIMGRHSNIILIDEYNTILESIKHISFDKSSIRQVLPGKKYQLPPNKDKLNPINVTEKEFKESFKNCNSCNIQDFIYKNFCGISPITSAEICTLSNLEPSLNTLELSEEQLNLLYLNFNSFFSNILNNNFCPQIILDQNSNFIDFTVLNFNIFKNNEKIFFNSISELLEHFYRERDIAYRNKQKTQDLKRIISQNIERCVKKKEIQEKTLKQIENRDKLKLYGELIISNVHTIKKGLTKVKLINFYSENYEEIEIPLDKNLTPAENSQKYFKKYNKEKRTYKALQDQIIQNENNLNYLQNVLLSLNNCTTEEEIKEIRQELVEEGILKKLKINKKDKLKKDKLSKPLHFVSSDNFNIYVGKNNKQNDTLTLKTAKPNDIWLHTKNIPGSHVIIVTDGKSVPDRTLEEGATLAAFYSKASNSSLVPVDYTLKKNIRKPNGAKPGMVIYETNKTIYITPKEEDVKKLTKLE